MVKTPHVLRFDIALSASVQVATPATLPRNVNHMNVHTMENAAQMRSAQKENAEMFV